MTEQEKAILAAYFAKPDSFQWTHNGATKTLEEWVTIRDDAAIAGAMSSTELGATLGKTMERASVPATDVKAAIASSAEFATMPESVMAKLSWFISSDPFPMSDAKMRDGVAGVLEAFTDARSKFLGLAVRPSSIAEALIGRVLSVGEVSEVLG